MIVTIELFRVDPYCSEFQAQIVGLDPDYIVLDQTHFFPRSSQQSCDVGEIDGVAVTGVARVDDEVRHLVHGGSGTNLAIGDIVKCEVNWERRYRTMRLHTAHHLLHCAIAATHDLGPLVGGSVTPQRATLEYVAVIKPADVEVDALRLWTESVVRERLLAVHEADSSVDLRRHWHIDGLASIACDGTHVRSTAEVGEVRIAVLETGGATIRLELELQSN